jgi:hypothetical protein
LTSIDQCGSRRRQVDGRSPESVFSHQNSAQGTRWIEIYAISALIAAVIAPVFGGRQCGSISFLPD